MKRYEVPVQENGRMILPAELRQELQVGKGSRVVLQRVGDRIELATARLMRAQAQARIREQFPDATNVVEEFIAERSAEALREVAEWDREEEELAKGRYGKPRAHRPQIHSPDGLRSFRGEARCGRRSRLDGPRYGDFDRQRAGGDCQARRSGSSGRS